MWRSKMNFIEDTQNMQIKCAAEKQKTTYVAHKIHRYGCGNVTIKFFLSRIAFAYQGLVHHFTTLDLYFILNSYLCGI